MQSFVRRDRFLKLKIQDMNNSEYYSAMKDLAREKRKEYGILTSEINISAIKKLYKKEGIKIDGDKTLSSKIRAAYFCDGDDCSVLLNSKLPREPKLFSLVHELKHHFTDRTLIEDGEIKCGDYNANQTIEIGAEVFAAEFIFPESEMLSLIQELGINRQNCISGSVVEIKRKSPVAISYTFILKRLVLLGLISRGCFANVKFQKLEEEMYPPIYKQEWFKQRRRNTSSEK